MWLVYTLISSLCLGGYDVLKKSSLKKNYFIPVLFFATLTGGVLFFILFILSRLHFIGDNSIVFVQSIQAKNHVLYMIKSIIVGTSWYFAYMALSQLPLTIVIPIRATGPVWTLIGALLIFQERFTFFQWTGIIIVLIFFYIFSLAGRKEGIDFHRNKWIFAIFAATLLGAVSSLYDKFLLRNFDRMAVQTWFSIYMVAYLAPFMLHYLIKNNFKLKNFKWRWSIPAIGIVLSLADFFYFYALSFPDSLVGIVSILRRGSVIISFGLGALLFKEKNIRSKAFALVGILIGITLLVLGSYL